MLYMSGQLPWVAGDLRYKGKIGGELTREDGYAACQLGALNAMAQIKKALGSFDRVRNILRLEGVLNVAPGFTETPRRAERRLASGQRGLPRARPSHAHDLRQPGHAARLRVPDHVLDGNFGADGVRLEK